MRRPWAPSLLAALLLVACASGTVACASGTGTPDSGTPDSGTPDSGNPPATGEPGSGPPPADAASTPEPATAEEASPAAQYADDPVAQKRGSDLFRALCTGYCHSTNAGEDTDASYLFDCDWTQGGSDREIFGVISSGVPETRMQAFGGKLPDEDLWKIVSFLRVRSEC